MSVAIMVAIVSGCSYKATEPSVDLNNDLVEPTTTVVESDVTTLTESTTTTNEVDTTEESTNIEPVETKPYTGEVDFLSFEEHENGMPSAKVVDGWLEVDENYLELAGAIDRILEEYSDVNSIAIQRCDSRLLSFTFYDGDVIYGVTLDTYGHIINLSNVLDREGETFSSAIENANNYNADIFGTSAISASADDFKCNVNWWIDANSVTICYKNSSYRISLYDYPELFNPNLFYEGESFARYMGGNYKVSDVNYSFYRGSVASITSPALTINDADVNIIPSCVNDTQAPGVSRILVYIDKDLNTYFWINNGGWEEVANYNALYKVNGTSIEELYSDNESSNSCGDHQTIIDKIG